MNKPDCLWHTHTTIMTDTNTHSYLKVMELENMVNFYQEQSLF